jgi:uncharacterized protein (TIGR02452 family)
MLSYSQKAAWLAKRRFFTRIAKENQNTLFPTLIDSDSRVKASLTNSILHSSTPPLDPLNDEVDETSQRTPIHVVKLDSFDCAEILTHEGKQNIVVLNMASSTSPGGGYLSGAGAQEEALCRRSTLYLTIRRQRNFHPIPSHGGIYSPDVLITRTNDDTRCALLPVENRWWTSVISVAGIKRPRLTPSEEDFAREADREDTRERIRTILRIAALQERKNLVLGSLGCGAYGNPPKAVAGCFKRVLQEDEFKNRFEGIWFAVIERGGTQNYTIFKEALDGLEI